MGHKRSAEGAEAPLRMSHDPHCRSASGHRRRAAEQPGRRAGRCGPHDAITQQLLAQFAEVPVGLGLTNDGLLLELYASPDGTWTALISNPAGVSCIVSFGVGWQSKGPSAVKENAPPMEPGD